MNGPRRRRRAPHSLTHDLTAAAIEVTIETLGARGDGLASHQGQTVYVPFSLPGERLRVRPVGRRGDGLVAEISTVIAGAPNRAAPACRHFADAEAPCGGCTIQHVPIDESAAFKRRLVTDAMARRGLDPATVATTVAIPPGRRRRATFSAVPMRSGMAVGFHRRDEDRIVDIAECPALHADLVALIEPLRRLLTGMPAAAKGGKVDAMRSETGFDLVFVFDREPGLVERKRLGTFAEDAAIARLSWQQHERELPEPIVVRREPVVTFAGISVVPPPGAFLQASSEGEAAIVAALREAFHGRPGIRRIADLFAGCGTLSFPLADYGRVRAVEENAAMTAAIARAAGQAGLGGKVETETRDLFRRPLAGKELGAFDAIVFDPPHTGAAEQARAIAETGRPSLVVAVSCNPTTFARDARTLVDGGYRLTTVTPIDQFPWSTHVELVGVFSKDAA